jgi:hypothetical protein
MNCYETTESLALLVSGDLDAQNASALEAHVGECASCAVVLDRTRAATGLAREALSSLEPDDGFTDAVMEAVGAARPGDARRDLAGSKGVTGADVRPSGLRVVRGRRRAVLAVTGVVAVAAAVLVAAILWPASVGRVASGGLAGGETEVVAGREYAVASDALVELVSGPRALVGEGSRFSIVANELALLEGSCVVAATGVQTESATSVVVGPDLVVRFTRADVYVHVGAGAVASGDGVLDWLMPVAYAAEGDGTCLVVAMAGDVELELAGATVAIRQGQAVFARVTPGDEHAETPFEVAEFIEKTDARLSQLEVDAAAYEASVRRYRRTIASYKTDLAAKRERLSAIADDAVERTELALRIRLVEDLERAHGDRLEKIQSQSVDGVQEELAWRMEKVAAAQAAYGRMLRLLDPAEPVSDQGADERMKDEGKVSP